MTETWQIITTNYNGGDNVNYTHWAINNFSMCKKYIVINIIIVVVIKRILK